MYVLPCVSVVTMVYHVIHLIYVLVINLRVPPMNLCIGVGTCFRLDCNAPDTTFHIRNSNSCHFRLCDMLFPMWLGFCLESPIETLGHSLKFYVLVE